MQGEWSRSFPKPRVYILPVQEGSKKARLSQANSIRSVSQSVSVPFDGVVVPALLAVHRARQLDVLPGAGGHLVAHRSGCKTIGETEKG